MESEQTQTDEEVGTAAGQTRTFLSTTGPYRNDQGHVIGPIGISRDVTNRKRLEAALAGNGCLPMLEVAMSYVAAAIGSHEAARRMKQC
ncbi:MAG: PAS domain-containing protein [Planctomycetales bacterium]|nr:PAS domain-containing protein [Planctomycetales bacterium]